MNFFILFLFPETKGLKLEDIGRLFGDDPVSDYSFSVVHLTGMGVNGDESNVMLAKGELKEVTTICNES